MTNINPYITIGGIGSRLKDISLNEKYNLYYYHKKIIEYIFDIIPEAKIIGKIKTNNRIETLQQIPISDRNNILIIDCDIIPFNFNFTQIDINNDCVYAFYSKKNKYGSLIVDNNILVQSDEQNNISNIKCSGVYFCKDLNKTINNMTDKNSIVSGMIGAKIIMENTFKRLGDIEDYYEAIGLC